MSAENVAPLISANPTGVSLDHSVCTVASRRQVPLVRLLAQSLREHNPDRVLDVLLVDDMASGRPDDASAAELRKDDGIRLHDRSRLALPDARLRMLALHYGADELALPLLPWFAEYFFSRGAQVVLYLHPETEVVAPLDPLLRHARKDGLVVWRRTLAQPLADVRRHPSDDEMIDDLTKLERAFWDRVQARNPPEPSTLAEVNSVYKVSESEKVSATEQIALALKLVKDGRAKIKETEEFTEELESQIKLALKGADTLVDIQGNVLATWKSQTSNRLDQKALQEAMPEIAKQFTRASPSRVFRIK